MCRSLVLIITLCFALTGLYASGGEDDLLKGLPTEIAKTSSGKIYFFERFDNVQVNMQNITAFVENWIEKEISNTDLVAGSFFTDTFTGTVRVNLTHKIDHSDLTNKDLSAIDSLSSSAHYTIKFVIHNHNLKVVLDNMYTSYEGVCPLGLHFKQSETIEQVYEELQAFESEVYEKAEAMSLEKLNELKIDISRINKSISKISDKDKDSPRAKKLIKRYIEKKKEYDKLASPEDLQNEINKRLQETIDYDRLFQVERWNDIIASVSKSLGKVNLD